MFGDHPIAGAAISDLMSVAYAVPEYWFTASMHYQSVWEYAF